MRKRRVREVKGLAQDHRASKTQWEFQVRLFRFQSPFACRRHRWPRRGAQPCHKPLVFGGGKVEEVSGLSSLCLTQSLSSLEVRGQCHTVQPLERQPCSVTIDSALGPSQKSRGERDFKSYDLGSSPHSVRFECCIFDKSLCFWTRVS